MKRYMVMDLVSRWVAASYISGKVEETVEYLFEGPTEESCYKYLRENVHPENEIEKADLEDTLDQYDLMRRLSKKNREKLLYCYHREKGQIVIRLREGWMWGEGATPRREVYNPKAVVVRTIKEFHSMMKYIEKI